MAIHTREELINNLVVAAELEHSLMVQYLYASMTLKTDVSEGLTADQVTMVSRWSAWIRSVAKQEMGHLATVLNLLEAIGGGSHLDRLRLPSATGLYTPRIPFALEPLTPDTIDRFVKFEAPAHTPGVALALAPDPVVVEHVSQLYRDIEAAIDAIPESTLFIGRPTGQDQARWSFGITVTPVTNRQTVHAAIDSIVVQGEGNASGSDDSHFGRFVKIRDQYKAARAAAPTFTPHRPVVANPVTLPPGPDHPGTTAITDPTTKAVAELFNACYTTLLLLLVKYYRFEETAEDQMNLQGAAKSMMMNVLATLGPLLSALPVATGSAQHAGPPFEIYTLPSLPNDRVASLIVLRERVTVEKAFADATAADVPNDDVLAVASAALADILDTIPA